MRAPLILGLFGALTVASLTVWLRELPIPSGPDGGRETLGLIVGASLLLVLLMALGYLLRRPG